MINEIGISSLPLDELRESVSYTPQSPVMLNVTRKEHIRFGRQGATENQICNAAKLAGADDFIRTLPEGYNTRLGADLESHFLETLKEIRKHSGRTIILVGHRLATTQIAGQIVVMDNGKIDCIGNHHSLMRQNGWYAKAYRKQTGISNRC